MYVGSTSIYFLIGMSVYTACMDWPCEPTQRSDSWLRSHRVQWHCTVSVHVVMIVARVLSHVNYTIKLKSLRLIKYRVYKEAFEKYSILYKEYIRTYIRICSDLRLACIVFNRTYVCLFSCQPVRAVVSTLPPQWEVHPRLGGSSRPCTQIEWTKLGISVLPCTVVQPTLPMYVRTCNDMYVCMCIQVHCMTCVFHVHVPWYMTFH